MAAERRKAQSRPTPYYYYYIIYSHQARREKPLNNQIGKKNIHRVVYTALQLHTHTHTHTQMKPDH
jgi:hypothetical protein